MHNGILKFNIIGLPYNFKNIMKSESTTGNLSYTAPELINEGQKCDFNLDTWSLGCCLYYMVTKKDPFIGLNS